MNLGQAAAVCLYELATRVAPSTDAPHTTHQTAPQTPSSALTPAPSDHDDTPAPSSANLEVLADLMEQVMLAANYSPKTMQDANRHDLRLMLRRLHFNAADSRRALGLFRRILRRLQSTRHP